MIKYLYTIKNNNKSLKQFKNIVPLFFKFGLDFLVFFRYFNHYKEKKIITRSYSYLDTQLLLSSQLEKDIKILGATYHQPA